MVAAMYLHCIFAIMIVTCKCGNQFNAKPYHIKKGYGKFCSRACSFKWRSSGPEKRKPYVLVKKNPSSFRRGMTPWNKGLKTGIVPANFKGENVGYDALHDWVNRHKGKASICKHCGKDYGRIEWANKSHEYKRDLNDWIPLCKSCHIKFDKIQKGISVIKEVFTLKGRNRI